VNARGSEQREGCWGRITVDVFGTSEAPSSAAQAAQAVLSESRYTWRPLPALGLPPEFQLELCCIADRQGVRRYVPQHGARAFVLQASLAGQAILAAGGQLNREQRQSYRVMQLFFQQADRLREHFGRSFKRAQDLWITGAVRSGERDVLPEHLGLDSRGRGERWTVNELLARGRESAIADGAVPPDEETCIRHGLLQAARINPWEFKTENPGESRQLVRLSLFDLGPADKAIDSESKAIVTRRLVAALKRHIGDSSEAFNRWFLDELDNVVHQVAKQSKRGGPIDRSIVRQVLLETVFDAYQYVAQGVSVAMRDFASATPVPLNPREREILEAMYSETSALGGLSLILLHDRFPWVREIVKEVFTAPGDMQRFGVLLRLLEYFAEMTSKRRAADREEKWKGLARNKPVASDAAFERFSEIARELRRRRNARCKCNSTENWRAAVESDLDGIVVLNDGCSVCNHNETITVTHDDLREVDQNLPDLERH
jgi:hypothetical protein